MSDRALLRSSCVLALLAFAPRVDASAQSVEEYTRRVDSVGRLWRASNPPPGVAPVEPNADMPPVAAVGTIDTVRVGRFVIFSDRALSALARQAAQEISSSLDSAYGRFAAELEKHPLVLRRRRPGDTVAAETGFAEGTAVRMASTTFANRRDLSVTWRRKVEELVTLSLDHPARTWLATVVSSEKPRAEDLTKGRVEFVLSGSTSAGDCAAGKLERCLQSLELVPVSDHPAFAHYDETARRGLVQRFASQLRRADEPKFLRCADDGRLAVCDSLVRSIPIDAVPRPLSPAVRQSFLQYVFLLGGVGSFERFASDTGSLADRIARSARQPIDTVVARWQQSVHSRSRYIHGGRHDDRDDIAGLDLRVWCARAEELAMALTFPRWLVAVVVMCALIWTGAFRNSKELASATTGNELGARGRVAGATARANRAQVTREADRLRLLLIRDSILSATKSAPPGLSLYIDPRFAEMRATLDSNVRAKWRALSSPSKAPVVVAALVDTATSVRGLPVTSIGWRLPITVFLPTIDGQPCLAIMRIPAAIDHTIPSFVSAFLRSPATIASLVSSCAYFAAFGAPGPHVARWLASTNWRYAVSTDWSAAAPVWKSRDAFYARGALPIGLSAFGEGELAVKSRLTMQGQACVAGRVGACGDAALMNVGSITDSLWQANIVSTVGANPASFYMQAPQTPLGPSDSWILSELVHDLGVERFATFWHSPLPVDSAFAAAAGRSLDAWLRAWTARVYGTFPSGPTTSISTRVSAIAWILIGVAIALVSAQRRRVV